MSGWFGQEEAAVLYIDPRAATEDTHNFATSFSCATGSHEVTAQRASAIVGCELGKLCSSVYQHTQAATTARGACSLADWAGAQGWLEDLYASGLPTDLWDGASALKLSVAVHDAVAPVRTRLLLGWEKQLLCPSSNGCCFYQFSCVCHCTVVG